MIEVTGVAPVIYVWTGMTTFLAAVAFFLTVGVLAAAFTYPDEPL